MHFKIVFAEDVYKDISQGLEYYETISEKLSLQFEDELLSAYEKLKSSPLHYFNLQQGFRRITLKTFPYMIIYKINKKEILVFAVFHQHINPKKLEDLDL